MQPRLDQIVIDSRDPRMLARFWSALLGSEPVDRARGWSHVEPPGFPRLAFQPVPEAKAAKCRMHLDIEVPAIAVAVGKAVALGASPIGDVVSTELGFYQVMQDPEGNEFCFVSN